MLQLLALLSTVYAKSFYWLEYHPADFANLLLDFANLDFHDNKEDHIVGIEKGGKDYKKMLQQLHIDSPRPGPSGMMEGKIIRELPIGAKAVRQTLVPVQPRPIDHSRWPPL
jgi:hypothetical protein